ncbi:MAG: hypothetical protein IT373_25835 [Polyangiaceae bacterium]|nr:hypothetical protein [Polyangiaceae bacterium]
MPSQPAAKEGDEVVGSDIHVVMVPSPGGPVPTPLASPFKGKLTDGLSQTTCVDNQSVALEGSRAKNDHRATALGLPWRKTMRARSARAFAWTVAAAAASTSPQRT